MGLITDPITFNARERGRTERGPNRNFDTAALARMLNGPEVQEKVRHGDMLGFFGHWPRLKFGMEPQEGGLIDGRAVSMPTAVRTVSISAEPDGTITHRQEFLDTNEGKIAQRLFNSKVGGFSSAITTVPRTSPELPRGFFGFDYVYEPNYTHNRGHRVALDGVADEARADLEELFDAVMGDASGATGALNSLFDGLHAQHLLTLEALERATRENEDLMAMLARGHNRLDSAALESAAVAGIRQGALPDYERFRAMPLSALAELPRVDAGEASPELDYASRRHGYKGR